LQWCCRFGDTFAVAGKWILRKIRIANCFFGQNVLKIKTNCITTVWVVNVFHLQWCCRFGDTFAVAGKWMIDSIWTRVMLLLSDDPQDGSSVKYYLANLTSRQCVGWQIRLLRRIQCRLG
jgi:hypothetical protein